MSQVERPEETLPSSNHPDIYVGRTFNSFNEFAERYENFLKSSFHPVFVVDHSKKVESYNRLYPKSAIPPSCGYKYIVYGCAHGRKIKSSSKGLRPNQSTIKKNCNANLTLKYLRKEKTFKITKCDFTHTDDDGAIVHSVSRDLFQMYCSQVGFRGINYTITRVIQCGNNCWKTTKEKPEAKTQMEKTALLLEYGTKVHNCRHQFKSETGIPISTRTLANKRVQLKDKNIFSNEKFLNELHRDETNREIVVEKVIYKNEIQLIYFQFSWMKILFEKYPEHILIDGTYSLMDTRMPLYTIMIVDGNDNSIPVAFGLLSQEKQFLLDHFISFFVKHNPKSVSAIESYMTDKDLNEMTVLAKHFPNAKHELCLFHVCRSMGNMVSNSDVPKRLQELARALLEKMVYAGSSEEFETIVEEFESLFGNLQLKTDFFDRWYCIKELWARYARRDTFNCGDTSNNRIESFNKTLKLYIKRYSSMDVFYKQLKLCMTHIQEKLETQCSDEQSKQFFNTVYDIDKNIEAIIGETATRFAGVEIKKELLLSSELKSAEFLYNLNGFRVENQLGKSYFTTYEGCSCSHFLMRRMPCRHMFYVRINFKQLAFEASLLLLRWRKSYFVNACNEAFASKQKVIVKGKESLPSKYVMLHDEDYEKYLNSNKIGNKLAEILKTSGKKAFSQREKILNHLIYMWSSGKNLEIDQLPKCIKERKDYVDVVHDDNSPKKPKVTVTTTPRHIETSTTKEVLPTAIKVRGRPKGSKFTAIGRIRKLPKPSERNKKRRIPTTLLTSQADVPLPTAAAVINEQPLLINTYDDQQQATTLHDKLWVKINNHNLNTEHMQILLGNGWLDDEIINSAQSILKRQHGSSFAGLQNCLMARTNPPEFRVVNGPFVQICNVNENHWLCIYGTIDPTDQHIVVDIFDSYASMSRGQVYPEVVSIVSSLTRHLNNHTIEFRQHNVTQQTNSYDCGLFAIAFAKYKCMRVMPCLLDIVQSGLRPHLYECLEHCSSDSIAGFPAKPNRGRPCVTSVTHLEKVYCICRTPATNVMISCANCEERFHQNCLEGQIESPYLCDRCKARL